MNWLRRAVDAPPTLLVCPSCRSTRGYVLRHIVGWKAGDHGAEPVPLGATVQCLDCGAVWHATDRGAELAKPLQTPQDRPKREKPDKGDSDLKWPWRDR